MESIRVFVTGAGSIVGQGIMKCLRISSLPVQIISADITPLNAGLFRAEESVLIPKVEEDGALDTMIAVVKQKRAHVVMVGSEFDLLFFAQHKERIERDTGVLVVVSPLETVHIADDKWLTAEFLRQHNLPYVESYVPESSDAMAALQAMANQWGYPVILKSRTGTSSRYVHVVRNEEELLRMFTAVPRPFLQKCIREPSQTLSHEYTCSIFKCRDETLVGPFTARRALRSGSSWIVEVDTFTELHSALMGIGKALPIMGSLNIQLMVGAQGPIPFELNARFSGTVATRAHFGFNEPEMVLRNYFLGEMLPFPSIRKGLALSFKEEVFVEGVSAASLRDPLPRGIVHTWF